MPSLLSRIAPSDAQGPWSGGIRRLGCEVKNVGAGGGKGLRRCGGELVNGGAARLEDVEPHHGPAEGLEVIVDVEGQPAIAPATVGLAGALAAAPSLATAAI